ncbi:MAG TPA: HEPN domain-containing protein [Solirubrobacterales bacterium]|nr:HEPN domain-containing protein [Solirubrobacterales bacterium]
MSPKRKVVVAREHLEKAWQEADGGDLRDAVQWAFAALEATIDALAEPQGIAIDEKHWKRTTAAGELHERGVLPKDLTELHRELNHLRKGVFYEGDDLDADEIEIEETLSEIENAVEIAERESTAENDEDGEKEP